MIGPRSLTPACRQSVRSRVSSAWDDAVFIKLRKASALVITHGQLLSVGRVSVLTRLTLIAEPMAAPPQELSQMLAS